MEDLKIIYNTMTQISNYPLTHVSQKDNLKFRIELGGGLMESYMRLGEIKEEINQSIKDTDYELYVIMGEGQDAILDFRKKVTGDE